MKSRIDDFVLGSLSPEERAAMEQARRHDPALDQRIRDAEDALAALSLAAGEMQPPAGLWKGIKQAIGTETRALDGRTITEFGDGDWQPVAPGIESKQLWNSRTALLRCAPGAVMPDHIHDDDEHILVLSGDFVIGGRTFVGGDYIGSRRGIDRFVHTTRKGCLILSQLGQ